MLHLQTSNQSPVTLQFEIFSLVAALVVVPAAIPLSHRGDILIFIHFLISQSSSSTNVKPELMY
jgi:hypothetical protein